MIFNKEKRLLNINLAEKHVKNIVSTPIIKLTMKSWSEKKRLNTDVVNGWFWYKYYTKSIMESFPTLSKQ